MLFVRKAGLFHYLTDLITFAVQQQIEAYMSSVKKRVVAIINPISGTQSKEVIPDLIDTILDKSRFDVDVRFTECAGHATRIGRQAVADRVDYVLSVGGDGTCNEIAKTLVHSGTALAIVPMGSGNGLARHLHIPMDVTRALRLVNDEQVIAIDYGKANDQLFFCTCGVGFDALVSLRFAQDKRRGGVTYVKKVITEYLKYKEETYELLCVDGAIREKAFLVACANASQYGNNAYIAPHANMQDGKMDITIIKPFTPLDIAPLALQLFTRTIDLNSKIMTIEKSAVTIVREKAGVMHIDGEPVMMDARIDVSCVHGGLRVLVPGNRKKSLIEPIQSALLEGLNQVKAELNI